MGHVSEGAAPGPTPTLSGDLRRALTELRQPQRLLVALDFDGTISPLVPVPSQARPLPGALDQLRRLAEAPGTEVVLVSGRGRDDLVEVSGAADIAILIGSHGQEIGDDLALDEDESALLASIRDSIAHEVSEIPGVRVEDKPAGVAVHVRGCAPADADRALAAAESVAVGLRGTHRLEGKLVIELSVRPLDKGTAMRSLIEADPERRVLFAGDDVTDESAMAALRPADVAIKVGSGESLARHRVADPAEMLRILEVLAELRGGPPGPPQDPGA